MERNRKKIMYYVTLTILFFTAITVNNLFTVIAVKKVWIILFLFLSMYFEQIS